MTRRALLQGILASLAQDENRPHSLARQLFPQPTGQNGYEELMQAADLLRTSDAFAAAEREGKRLFLLRRALDDPPVRRARALIRQAMPKPMRSPRADQPIGLQTLLPDLAGLRRLARLLAMEVRVGFADGRSASAIHAAFAIFRLTDAIRGETLIAGLVEVACDTLALTAVIRHADTWTVPDCLRLLTGIRSLLPAPHPGALALEGERRFFQEGLDETLRLLAEPNAPETLGVEIPDGEGERLASELRQRLRDPAGRETIKAHLRQRQEALIAAHLRYLDDPSSDPPGPPAFGDSPEERLLGFFLPALDRTADRFIRLRVQLQLLGVHAALRRWRWENDAYPATLAEMKLEDTLAIDPYTRQPLLYERKGDLAYDLSSAGPRAREGAGRQPIRLP